MGEVVYCSFCGKSQHEVKKVFAGKNVAICSECTAFCMEILKEEEIEILSRRIATFVLCVRRIFKSGARRPERG